MLKNINIYIILFFVALFCMVITLAHGETASIVKLKQYKFVPSIDSYSYDTEKDSKTIDILKDIDINKTVLVVIDFWNNVAPDAVMNNTNEVIKLARRNHIKIVHFPTGNLLNINPMVHAVDSYPDEWVMTGLNYSRFDDFLKNYNIENILYAGFHNGWCIFYKPLGMDMQSQRTPNINLILIKDATDSFGSLYWVNQWANNTAEHKFHTTTIKDLSDALSDTVNLIPFASNNMQDEKYSIDQNFGTYINPRQSALILINPWNDHENDGWKQRSKSNNQNKLRPLLDMARKNKMKVMYVSNERTIDLVVAPNENEPVFTDKSSLWEYLLNYRPSVADIEYGGYNNSSLLYFDGSTYVDLGNKDTFKSKEITIEVSVVSSNLIPNEKIICFYKSVGTPFAAYQIRIGDDGKSLVYQYYSDNRWNTIEAPDFFTESEFITIAVSHSFNNEINIYKNGDLLKKSQQTSSLDYSDTTSLRIGARAEKEYWHGNISDLRLWNYVKDSATIKNNLSSTLSGSETGLIGYWKIDEGDGTIINDSSVYGNKGKINGGSWNAPYIKKLIFAGNITNEAEVFSPLDSWGLTVYNGGSTTYPYADKSKFQSRLLEDSIVAFESPESLQGEHFKKTFLSRAVIYGGTRHKVTTAAILAENLKNNLQNVFTVKISDYNLEMAIRQILNKFIGDITNKDMESIISLNAENKNITSLAGLEYATNLDNVNLKNNKISDIAPLVSAFSFCTDKRSINIDLNNNYLDDVNNLKAAQDISILKSKGINVFQNNKLLNFSGQTYVNLGNKDIYKSREFTIEATVFSTNLTPNQKIVCYYKSVGTPFAAYQLRVGDDGRSLSYQYYSDNRWNTVEVPNYFVKSEDLNIAVSHSLNNEICIYKNGGLIKKAQLTSSIDYFNTVSLRIGARAEKEFWNGNICNVKLWGTVRNNDAIKADSNNNINGNEPGLIGYWKMDEGEGTVIHDYSDNESNGTIVRGSWVDASQFIHRKLLKFGGTTFADLGNTESFKTKELTIEVSVVNTNLTPNQKIICFYKSVGTPYAAYQLRVGDDGKSLFYQYYSNNRWNTLEVPDFFVKSHTNDIAVTHNINNEISIYKNGELVKKGQLLSALDFSNTVSLRLGARAEKEYWYGNIGNLRLWNVARDGATIKNDFVNKLIGNESGLIGYWKMDEGEGTVLYDSSPGGNNGTIFRGSWVDPSQFSEFQE